MPAADTPRLLDERVWAAADQERFAALSGDRNPMHMDAVAARRLLTGRPVVHGIHLLLWALERWAQPWPEAAWRLVAEFSNPVSVGDRAELHAEHDALGQPIVVAAVDGLPCCRLSAQAPEQSTLPLPPGSAELLGIGAEPLQRPPEAWSGSRQQLALAAADFTAAFPKACARIGPRAVATLALLSAYVGMVCPGLHSVFSSLQAQPGAADAHSVVFEVRRYDARLRMFTIAFDGPLRGELRAFVRAAAQVQPNTESLRALVSPGEFAGAHHWVIGGSRGLGELVAKLAAAGGAGVTVTHASGAEDAQAVVQDILAAGCGPAAPRRLDILHDDIGAWLQSAPWPDAVWYFATPRIFRKKAGFFDAAALHELLTFYVLRFEALCQALEVAADGRPVRVFYPSTIFIEERPKGMTEYAMAKAAAEVLVADLARRLRQVKPVARRLPRMATDQTAGLFAAGAQSNAQVMLPVMREFLAR